MLSQIIQALPKGLNNWNSPELQPLSDLLPHVRVCSPACKLAFMWRRHVSPEMHAVLHFIVLSELKIHLYVHSLERSSFRTTGKHVVGGPSAVMLCFLIKARGQAPWSMGEFGGSRTDSPPLASWPWGEQVPWGSPLFLSPSLALKMCASDALL